MGAKVSKALYPLTDAQAAASDPGAHVWLSASAGTGKTQVLASRVFRLLLRGVEPGAIQCLTFTKAGAAEMAGRINERLAAWVRMPETELARDLDALGERATPALIAGARTLFAKVLDAPGGGLRIQTIHGFCQGLLAAFPVEAGLAPGFRPLDAREEAVLMRETLAGLLADAQAQGRERPVQVIGALSLRMGEGGAEDFLHACARGAAALDELPSGIAPWLRRRLDLPPGDIAAHVAARCDEIDCDALAEMAALNRAWGTGRGLARATAIEAWVAGDAAARSAGLDAFARLWSTAKGHAPQDEGYADGATAMRDECAELASLLLRGAYADLLADGLEIGREYARAWTAAKRRAGAVDFDDLIRTVVRLFQQPGIGDWVRYKLDQTTAHVLIDEAQDTNAQQWAIVRSLVEEFFQGRGIFAPSTRTLFTVGDYKQAIFGFQGTDPLYFEAAGRDFIERARLAEGADDWPMAERGLPMRQLSLTQSYRSTKAILRFVDHAMAAIPAPGLEAELEAHASEVPGPGRVELWPPAVAGDDDVEPGEEGFIDEQVRKLAGRIAKAVRGWLDDPTCRKRDGTRLLPQDVMILVKRRGDIASLLVARLHAEGVPVAGVDRLKLTAPLAVQDLLAAIRFALQPDDDLSLASLLVSPLIGWTQEALMMAAGAPRQGSLWRHLGDQAPDALRRLLARADIATPYQLLEEVLSGPMDGRRRLIERLGAEARDPIEELLNAALQFESATTPSLQRFLDWFDRGEVEIVRDPSAPQTGELGAVRVMTAHGAKGLQAPVVILADACVDPGRSPRSVIAWAYDDGHSPVPVFRPRAGERGGPMDERIAALERRELAENWRLFYVAATRAEERLVIAGSLGPRAKGPPEASWYAAAAAAMDALGVPAGEGERIHADGVPATPREAAAVTRDETALPGWARERAPIEQRPSRPLAPSALGDDAVADPPPTPAMRMAAERGRLLHRLFERLPAVAAGERRAAAERWLAGTGGVGDPVTRAEIAGAACAIVDDPAFAALFGPDSLAEAPVTAVVDGVVIAGTVDRLLVTADRIRVIDFKTGRRAPATLRDLPDYHLRQMAAYRAALAVIFPGRPVEAALLYTAGPTLFALPGELLDARKPGLVATEQS